MRGALIGGESVSLRPQNCIYNIKTFIVNKYLV